MKGRETIMKGTDAIRTITIMTSVREREIAIGE